MTSCHYETESVAVKVENEFVHDVYDNISGHFNLTRHSPWPNVLKFVNSFSLGSVLLDVGCGNGKYFGFNKCIYELGGDSCHKLTDICKDKGFEVIQFNCLNLPFIDHISDGIICIAVLHHLATHSRRLKAVQEIMRVLKDDGKALIYTWAKDQKNSKFVGKPKKIIETSQPDVSSNENTNNLRVNDSLPFPVHSKGAKFEHSDLLVPWKLNHGNMTTHFRYYHVFEEKELENLCCLAGASILSSYYEEGNWCVIIQKKNN